MRRFALAPLALALLPVQEKERPVRPGKWNPRNVPPGWIVDEKSSRDYHVQSQISPETTKVIVDHLEGMMETYEKFRPFRKERDRYVLKIFKDRASYTAYGSPGSSVAYYSQAAKELVCYDTGKVGDRVTRDAEDTAEENRKRLGNDEPPKDAPPWRKEAWPILQELRARLSMDLLGVLSHEGWHQYFHHYIVSIPDFPSWLDEGLGDFFYMAPENLASLDALRDVPANEVRFPALRLGLLEGKTAAWKEILAFRQEQYYANAQTFYAQGWSMTHFLLTHPDPKVREIIPNYLTRFKDGKLMDRATTFAFRGHDIDKLESEWKQYVAGLRFKDPETQALLEQAEAILMKHLGQGAAGGATR